MVKEKKPKAFKTDNIRITLLIFPGILILTGIFILVYFLYFEKKFENKIYPGIRIDGISFGGKSKSDVENYFHDKNIPLKNLRLTLVFEDKIATLSSQDLNVYFDGKLSAAQAYSVGRSGQFLTDNLHKWQGLTYGLNFSSILNINKDSIDETLERLSEAIDIGPQDALFQFENGKVITFRQSKPGRGLNKDATKKPILSYINSFSKQPDISPGLKQIDLQVDVLNPRITTENSNNFGIKELLGTGKSRFHGSIPGRIHNVALAADKINGHLISPGAEFSFNDTVGDISASTGFQPAYIIKEGRTVLGDGGGVCQVSTTLFRAALNAGFPVTERHAHAYRVHYYEEESPIGLDATVFAPSYDLKFKNDTPNYILIQAKTDTDNYSLAFDLYGTSDGRMVTITKPVLYGETPPPPDLFQDDPTLPLGMVKQVDWSAWGGKTNFDYSVERNGQVINKQSFFSNYQPWRAIFLKGTKT